jgi:hypothetical protein
LKRCDCHLHAPPKAARRLVALRKPPQQVLRREGSGIAQRLGERDEHRAIVRVSPGPDVESPVLRELRRHVRGAALERTAEGIADDRTNERSSHAILP